MNLFGAKTFKKYWVVCGSFWNVKHIDKNNIKDLETVIDGVKNYTAVHLQCLFFECLLYIMVWFFEVETSVNSWKAIFVLMIIHTCAFMIQYYNWILASDQIYMLKLNVELTIDCKKIDSLFCLQINNNMIGPQFMNENQCQIYKTQLLLKYSNIYQIYLANFYNKLPTPSFVTELLKNDQDGTNICDNYKYNRVDGLNEHADIDCLFRSN